MVICLVIGVIALLFLRNRGTVDCAREYVRLNAIKGYPDEFFLCGNSNAQSPF